ncbi:retrovirus-related pol polyprotein from transposon TNT 1-94 [Tanacetum coccineum]|uniref:Retrovirus-related pol polyprotein from transposon TNT 1-94 n=1 Tax=Tanacetum coccineum TaxID=301880 RepID=A0ABQ5H2Z3_9ASTR
MDLHPCLPPIDLSMNKLSEDVIGIYVEQLDQVNALPSAPLILYHHEKPNKKIVKGREKKEKQSLLKAQAKRVSEASSAAPNKKKARKNTGPVVELESEKTISTAPLQQSFELQKTFEEGVESKKKDVEVSIVDLSDRYKDATSPQVNKGQDEELETRGKIQPNHTNLSDAHSFHSKPEEKEKKALVAQLAQSEMSHQGIIKDFIPTTINRLYTSVEYQKNLAGPTSLLYIAGWLGGLGLGRTKEEISKILPNTRNLDIEGSNVWRDRCIDEPIDPKEVVDMKKEVEDGTNDEPVWSLEKEISRDGIEELVEMPRSQPVGYYLKHEINKKLIEGLIGNQRYNDSLLATCLCKMDYETYNSLLVGPMYDVILKKKKTKKEDMGGNFMIPCNVGGLKYMDALVDQGSDVNVMPLFHLQWANQQKAPDYIYPVDFIILDVKEDKKKPFILGTPFLTTAKAEIRFDKGTITLKSGKNKINFFKIPESPCRVEEGTN